MPDPRDSLDLSVRPEGNSDAGGGEGSRPCLRVYFACANKYTHVYRRPDAGHYTARCPQCGKAMTFKVGEGGTSERFFQVSCR